MFEGIPKELKDHHQWVCALKDSKMPMKVNAYEPASAVDPATWSSFHLAAQSVQQGYYPYIGYVFNDNGYVGIDIDDGWDEDGFLSSKACDIIRKCKSYTEHSKSGRGFHILLKGSLPFKGRNNQAGVEIYRTGRYFILTGKVMCYDTIIENQAAIDEIVSTYFPETVKESCGEFTERIYNPIWQTKRGRIALRPHYPEIPRGSRNLCLTSLAGMLKSQGYTKDQIFDELLFANETACTPKLERAEIKTIVRSVLKYSR